MKLIIDSLKEFPDGFKLKIITYIAGNPGSQSYLEIYGLTEEECLNILNILPALQSVVDPEDYDHVPGFSNLDEDYQWPWDDYYYKYAEYATVEISYIKDGLEYNVKVE